MGSSIIVRDLLKSLICIKTGVGHRSTKPTVNKIEAKSTSYFEIGGRVEWPHSSSESM